MSEAIHKLYISPVVTIIKTKKDIIDSFQIELKKLIEHSAQEIIISDETFICTYDLKENDFKAEIIHSKEYIEKIPPLFRKRIKVINIDSIEKKLSDFTQPLFESSMQKTTIINNLPLPLESYISSMNEDLINIYVASKYNSSTFFPINIREYIDIINSYQKFVKDDIVNERLSIIKGILNVYKQIELDTFYFPSTNFISMKEMFNEILDDLDMIKISEHRYNLGKPSKMKYSLAWLRKNFRKLWKISQYNKYISVAKSAINIGLNQSKFISEIPELKFNPQRFCPQLIIRQEFSRKELSNMLTSDENIKLIKIAHAYNDLITNFGIDAYLLDRKRLNQI